MDLHHLGPKKTYLSSADFVGRISLTLTLGKLALSDCNRFWPKNISSYENFKVLAVPAEF
ncbi:hypothetical protein [Wolbachia endosymbiont of Mansonella ozzardi]|uniref:hypothetical protein n=1 Tax=Wolbachia endosymbiont of Mansonella ozzardi TaxID=137464 RepID=UPI001CE14AB8|nr:hypothetical protein [Wolbachia endosymbiont of Mansonella ozzardi]